MASGPIPSWQIEGETVETVAEFTFFAYINNISFANDDLAILHTFQ